MAALRDLVTGSDACTPGDGAGPSNAAASLADTLLGRRSKQQAQLHELPGFAGGGPSASAVPFQPPSAAQAAEAALYSELPPVPGLAPGGHQLSADVDAFLRGAGPGQLPNVQDLSFQEFDAIYGPASHAGPLPFPSDVAAAAARTAVQPFLAAFLQGSRGSLRSFLPPQPLTADLSVPDKCRIRDRSTILARHVFADRGSAFADQQVNHLLHSLNIDPAALPAGGDAVAWERIFQQGAQPSLATDHAAAAAMAHAARTAEGPWVQEFEALRLGGGAALASAGQEKAVPAAWAEDFAGTSAAAGPSNWADEFRAAADAGSAARSRAQQADTLEQTRRLAETLAADSNPKFRNSQFLQFVSKMSRGELILEDNGVREVPPQAATWAEDFSLSHAAAQQPGGGQQQWAEEFAPFQADQHAQSSKWAAEFGDLGSGGVAMQSGAGDWASEFANGVAGGWVEEFAADGRATSTDVAHWEEEYAAELERLNSAAGPRAAGAYVMAERNPFLGDLDSLAKGKDLFRRGVLTEAVLALEAECQRNPGNAEAWRLLGTVQAENDDDQQAIAAMNRALAADPDNLDVLLSLGVSHTNELEQAEALGYLRQWLTRHPTHGAAARAAPAPPDSSQALAFAVRTFRDAAAAAPRDADAAAALGVLCNLSRRYDEAVDAFRAALALRPQDYSLWNKLGATLANSARSGEALGAYQKALELKPNYMRAWTNMGIAQANLGEYESSARYYVRALSLNRSSPAVWSYLRTSIACAGRQDLAGLVDSESLEGLQRALPL